MKKRTLISLLAFFGLAGLLPAASIAVSPFSPTTVTSNTYTVKWISSAFYSTNVLVTLSYSNAAGGPKIGFYTNWSMEWMTNSYVWNISGLADGSYFILAHGWDGMTNHAYNRSAYALFKTNMTPPPDTTPPTAPVLVSPRDNLYTNSVFIPLKWQKSIDTGSGVSNYRVFVNGVQIAQLNSVLMTNYTAIISNNGIFTWRVKAYDRAGNTNTSVSRTLTVDTLAPSVPNPISPANGASGTNSSWTFLWNRSVDMLSGVSNYQIVFDGTNANITSMTLFNKSFAVGAHTWRVRAMDRAGNWSGWSTLWSMTRTVTSSTDILPPAAPQGLRAVTLSGMVFLSWAPSAEPDIAGYKIFRAGADGNFTQIGTAASNSFTDNAADIAPGSLLRYKVTAHDSSGNNSGFSSTVELALLSVTDTGENPVTLSRNRIGPDTEQDVVIVVNGKSGKVKIRILDVSGRLVTGVFDGEVEAGQSFHTWSLSNNPDLASGLYIVVIEGHGWKRTEKIFVVK